MSKIGDAILVIGDWITITCYAIKYWLRGETWKDAVINATNIIDAGWR